MKNIVDIYKNLGKKVDSQWVDSTSIPSIYNIKKVCGVCFREDGKILVVEKSSGKGWSLPGGKHEYLETTFDTLTRETDEEASVVLAGEKVLGYIQNTYKYKGRESHSVELLIYSAIISELKKSTKDPSINRIRKRKFIDLDDLCSVSDLSGFEKNIQSKAKEVYDSDYVNLFKVVSDNY